MFGLITILLFFSKFSFAYWLIEIPIILGKTCFKVRSHGAAVAMLVLVFFIALPLKVFT